MAQTKEQRKVSGKKYYEKHKEKVDERVKKYKEENKEKIKEHKKEYYKENKERIDKRNKEYSKDWNQSDAGKKSFVISAWKQRGVICDDFDSLYDKFINCKNCEECAVELVDGNKLSNRRCLDHSHKTGLFRNVLCNTCNTKRGE
tara:strand:- start:36 stop:470 length:435 start_codon:yes stop_codon:yes gene_type:complete